MFNTVFRSLCFTLLSSIYPQAVNKLLFQDMGWDSKLSPGGEDREMHRFCMVITQFTALLFCEVPLLTADFCWVSCTIDNKWSTKVAQLRVYGAFSNWATTSESVDGCNVGTAQKRFCRLFSHLHGWAWSAVLSSIEHANRGNYCALAKTAQFDGPFHPDHPRISGCISFRLLLL